MGSALGKAYEKYEDNGGEVAITGFNFQAFTGIYYMLFLHKNNKIFEIKFEKEDDIIIDSENKKFKIQVKSENLTLGKIVKKDDNDRCILGKLLFDDSFDYYFLVFPHETGSSIKKICTSSGKILGGDCYMVDLKLQCSSKEKNHFNEIKDYSSMDGKNINLIFQEMKFTKDTDNCCNYLLGYARNDLAGERIIPLKREQMAALLGTIYCVSTKKFSLEKLSNEIFKNIEEEEKQEILILEYIELLGREKTPTYKNNFLSKKGEFDKDKEYYKKLLDKIEIPVFDDEEPFVSYFNKCIEELDKSLDKIHKEIIDKYIKGWYIIYKIVEGGEKS